MADYHPLIARAVAGLEKNTGENRRALYERARTALVAQLRGVQPALDESEITRERLALEEAIRKVEAESARQARDSTRGPLVRRAEPPARPAAPSPRPVPAAPRSPMTTAAVMPRSRGPLVTATPPQPPPAAPVPPAQPAPPQARHAAPAEPHPPRTAGGRRTLSDEALKGFRDVVTDPQQAIEQSRADPRYEYGDPYSLPPAPTLPQVEPHPLEPYGQLEPQVQPDHLWATQIDGGQPRQPVDYDQFAPPQQHPRAQQTHQPQYDEEAPPAPRPPRQPRSYAGIIRLVTILALVGVIGGLIYWQRGTIGAIAGAVAELFSSRGPTQPREAQPTQKKITDRIGQPAPAGAPGVPVAQRVVLYEEDPDDSQGKRFVGTAVWRTEMKPAAPGRPPELAVRADIEIPDRKMTATWSLRRNTDQSLPASHTIEIVFNIAQDAQSGGVQNVPGVLMKQAEQTRGVPLAGLAVKVTPGFFLIGLSAVETDTARNLQLLKERGWFDIPIVYNNNRRAILAMEKGTPGEKAFGDAFAAWKQ